MRTAVFVTGVALPNRNGAAGANGEPAGAVFFVPGGRRTTSDVRQSARDFRKVANGLPKDAGDPIHGRPKQDPNAGYPSIFGFVP